MRQKELKKKKKKLRQKQNSLQKISIRPMILENIKQYMFFVMKLEILLICS